MGDEAMLRVTVSRVRERWPLARIGVITMAPPPLAATIPGVEPIVATGTGSWSGRRYSYARAVGPRVVGPMTTARLAAREASSGWKDRVESRQRPLRERPAPRQDSLVPGAIETASLILAVGGGYVTDMDAEQARRTLAVLQRGIEAGIPTAMLGQGLGPLDDEDLLRQARAVLPHVGLVALREGERGPGLLRELGVPAERVVVTGDMRSLLPRTCRGMSSVVASPSASGTRSTRHCSSRLAERSQMSFWRRPVVGRVLSFPPLSRTTGRRTVVRPCRCSRATSALLLHWAATPGRVQWPPGCRRLGSS